MSQCPFANILGEPGKGVHAPRLFGLARNDIIATILGAIITSYVYNINIVSSIIGWFVAGEILHYIFGVNTAFLQMIHISPKC